MENKLVSKMKEVLNSFKPEGGVISKFSSFDFGGFYQTTQVGKVSYNSTLARQMYQGESEFYSGDYFATKVVNQTRNSVGVPLNESFEDFQSTILEVLENIFIGDDQFVRLYLSENPNNNLFPEKKFVLNMINYSENQIQEYEKENGIIKEITIKGENNITETITEKKIIKRDGSKTTDSKDNQFGFVPVVHFEKKSEIKPIANLIRSYHIVSNDNLNNFEKNSKPKLKIKAKSLEQFITRNFSEKEIASGKLNFKNKVTLRMGQDDNAEYIQVESTTEDAKSILHLLFYAIVAVSEIPEFLFGTHIQSSNASVSEQLLPFLEKIKGKRKELEENFQLLNRVITIINTKANGNRINTEKLGEKIRWPEILRNEKEKIEMLEKITTSLQKAIMDGYISKETAHKKISQYIDTLDWKEEEKKILKEAVNGDQDLAQYMQYKGA